MVQQYLANILTLAIRELYGLELVPRLEFTPMKQTGDFAFRCYDLLEFLSTKENPKPVRDIATELHAHPKIANFPFGHCLTADGYLNFVLDRGYFAKTTIDEVLSAGEHYGWPSEPSPERTMVEYLSPNTNKPLHLGHLRNGCIGMTIVNLLRASGQEVIPANLINDRGIHICKSMLAWQIWGMMETPITSGMKGDHLIGKYYVKFETQYKEEVVRLCAEGMSEREAKSNAPLIKHAEEMLERWEAGDELTRGLWEIMNNWVLEGFDQTYRDYGFIFDKFYFESQTYLLGRDIVMDGLARGIFVEEDDAVVIKLDPAEFGKNKDGTIKCSTVLRANGTSLYMTQDLGTAVAKVEEFDLDNSIYVVANEQDDHFSVLFHILRCLGYEWADKARHRSYGMVNLPDGRMKSREGTAVDADELLSQMTEMVLVEVDKRHEDLDQTSKVELARKIALSAIKFYLLIHPAKNSIKFDPASSISFNGKTGPYVLYSATRAKAVLAKAEGLVFEESDYSLLVEEEETALLRSIIAYPDKVQEAIKLLEPSKVAEAVYDTAKCFNEFYQKWHILQGHAKLIEPRLRLTMAALQTIQNGLALMGIEDVDVM